MRLLKDLSKERLVIVVSHDREYAHQYADRIIELSDGAIISDTQSEYQQTNHSTNYISSSSKISWKTVFKIGSQGFKLHPFRFLSTIFLSLITFTLFSVIFTFSTTTTESRVIQSFKDNHLTQTALTKYFQNLLESKYTHEEYLYLKEELPTTVLPIVSSEITIDNLHNTELLTSIYHQIQPLGYSTLSPLDISSFGFSLIGDLPTSTQEVVITSFLAEMILLAGLEDEDTSQKESLIQKEIILDSKSLTIVGILDTKLEPQYQRFKDIPADTLSFEIEQFYQYLRGSCHALVFVHPSQLENHLNFVPRAPLRYRLPNGFIFEVAQIERISTSSKQFLTLSEQGNLYLPLTEMASFLERIPCQIFYKNQMYTNYQTLFDQLVSDYTDQHLDEFYQIALTKGYKDSIDHYRAFIMQQWENPYGLSLQEIQYDVYSQYKDIYQLPSRFTTQITCNEFHLDQEHELGGFYVQTPHELGTIYVQEKLYQNWNHLFGGNYDTLILSLNNFSTTELTTYMNFVSTDTNFSYTMENFVMKNIDDLNSQIKKIIPIMQVIGVILGGLSAILLIHFILQSTTDRTSTLSILKCIGCTNFDILKIFMCECFVFNFIIFLSTTCFYLFSCLLINKLFFIKTGIIIAFLPFNFLTILLLFLLTFGFSTFGILIPVIKFTRARALDYIHN